MKTFILIIAIMFLQCSEYALKYDGEIIRTSKGDVVKLRYQGFDHYAIEQIDTVQILRAVEFLNKKSKE